MHDLLISPINLDARARAVLRIGVEAAAATSARAHVLPLLGDPCSNGWLRQTDIRGTNTRRFTIVKNSSPKSFLQLRDPLVKKCK